LVRGCGGRKGLTATTVLAVMTVPVPSFFLLFILLNLFAPLAASSADYHERLLLRPLPPSSLLASFNFRSNASSSFEHQNFRYFPRSLGQILQHANTRELHLRFSLGRWDAESWGARPWGGAREGGTGVELWAWVEARSDEELVFQVNAIILCHVACRC
jgi:phosphatidylinositol glycan class T